jgi:hypothetical protein
MLRTSTERQQAHHARGKSYDVTKGAGVYLGPSERATIEAMNGSLKLFVLVVPKIPG